LDVDELIQRSYTVKKDSPLYQREVAPFLAKMQQMSPSEMAQAGKKLKMLRLEVQVHFNRAAAETDARTKAQLQVAGAAYSYVTEDSEDKRSQTVVVLFGDWKSAKAQENGLTFHFKHPAHTPVIENIVVQLHGSPDRIRELLKSADWKSVNGALVGAGS
jgi:poly(3-hydroxybutyrate) depolymerase